MKALSEEDNKRKASVLVLLVTFLAQPSLKTNRKRNEAKQP